MKTSYKLSALLLAAATLLGGCASYGPDSSSSYSQPANYSSRDQLRHNYGTIDSIQTIHSSRNTGAGAVVGGLVGALVGNGVGGGSGRTAATVIGAVGGAVVGNNVENNRNSDGQTMYEISIRMDNGEYTRVVQDSVYDLREGNRVRVIDGRAYRY
jgi:outer membrane lipoprotein SlyB